MRYFALTGLIILGLSLGCQEKEQCLEVPDSSGINVEIEIERLDQQLFEANSAEEIVGILRVHPAFTSYFLGVRNPNQVPDLATRMLGLLKEPSIDTLYDETLDRFGDLSELRDEMTLACRNITYYYPQFRTPKVQTVVTGFARDLYLSDSLFILGLDYYIGAGARWRPREPNYILQRLQPEYLVPQVISFISADYMEVDVNDNSLLGEMINFGKSYFFTKRMLPCTPDSLIIGYSSEELKDITNNEDIIWANFVQNEILYKTDHITKQKFIGERPSIPEIGEKCPGRIAAWLGWRIVESYMANNKVTLQQMMAEKNVQKIFTQSKYKPQTR